MRLLEYNKLQLRFIHSYAKHLHMSDEKAVYKWLETGLAVKFCELYK